MFEIVTEEARKRQYVPVVVHHSADSADCISYRVFTATLCSLLSTYTLEQHLGTPPQMACSDRFFRPGYACRLTAAPGDDACATSPHMAHPHQTF
mmetsp:Transcript_7237/g.11330  ORF Transcript_7237/g.11330 Transcript_7237/m.11330 type:complete len:95 (-) Transcript_7237:14-298(-)